MKSLDAGVMLPSAVQAAGFCRALEPAHLGQVVQLAVIRRTCFAGGPIPHHHLCSTTISDRGFRRSFPQPLLPKESCLEVLQLSPIGSKRWLRPSSPPEEPRLVST